MSKESFSVLKKIYQHLRVKGKPLTVHTEMIIEDDVWEEVKKRVKNNEIHTWYLMTPVNYNLISTMFKLKYSLKEYEEKLKKRYLWLKKNKQKLQLHIHLSKKMKNLVYWEQELIIKQAVEWLEDSIDIKVTEMVPGWWNYNEDTINILENLNIKLIKRFEYRECHDYDWIRDPAHGRI